MKYSYLQHILTKDPSGMINTEIQLKKGLVGIFRKYDYNFNELLSDQITSACLKSLTNLEYFTYKLIKTRIHEIAADRHDLK